MRHRAPFYRPQLRRLQGSKEAQLEAPLTATPTERVAPGRIRWRARSRWIVHLGLLISAAASLGTLDLLHIRVAIHADVGLVFLALVAVHLVQRRHRLTRMASQLLGLRPRIERELRVLASDAVLLFFALNVLVSGVVDWSRGTPAGLPFPAPLAVASGFRPDPRRLCGGPYRAAAQALTAIDDSVNDDVAFEPHYVPRCGFSVVMTRGSAAESLLL